MILPASICHDCLSGNSFRSAVRRGPSGSRNVDAYTGRPLIWPTRESNRNGPPAAAGAGSVSRGAPAAVETSSTPSGPGPAAITGIFAIGRFGDATGSPASDGEGPETSATGVADLSGGAAAAGAP